MTETTLIARRMARLKLAYSDVATACGVTEASVRAWATKRNAPNGKYLVPLAACLKVTVETLAKDFAGARP